MCVCETFRNKNVKYKAISAKRDLVTNECGLEIFFSPGFHVAIRLQYSQVKGVFWCKYKFCNLELVIVLKVGDHNMFEMSGILLNYSILISSFLVLKKNYVITYIERT